MPGLSAEVKNYLERVDQEGLDYATVHYADWKEVKSVDPKLYGLISDFQSAYEKLDHRVDNLMDEFGDELWD